MKKNIIIYFKIALFSLFLVVVDQVTKYCATLHLKGKNDFIIIKDVLHFHYLDGGNSGAAWGIFSGKITMFITFTIIAILLIILFVRNITHIIVNVSKQYFKKNTDNNSKTSELTRLKLLNFSLAALMAGALGNLIDRILYGYVIDFIYFKLINFPIFNVADCYVTVSCALILFICIFKLKDDEFNNIFSLKINNKKL